MELLVVAAGLPAGYWAVSFFLGGRHKGRVDTPAARPASWPEVLGVSPDAATEDIRAAHRQLLDQFHPDKEAALGPEWREQATRRSQQIDAAYRAAMAERGEPA